jgi:multidrug efflux system membrane fusion protein
VAIATQRDVPIYLEGLGSAVAYMTVTVRTQVDGRLDQVLFREGQYVEKGDLLAVIDPRPFEAQLRQAEGARIRDTAQLRDAELNLERYIDLRKRNLVAQQQVDDQRALVGQVKGALAIDEAQIKTARLNLDYAHIRSPIAGRTGIRQVDPGNVVHAADPNGIVVITQLDPIAVLFTLPEEDLVPVSTEMANRTLEVEAESRDGRHHLGRGELALIDNQINQATGTIRMKAIFPNPKRILWPNQFVKARLHLRTEEGALTIPASAVERGPDGTFAWLVDTSSVANPRPIATENLTGDIAIVQKGLDPGARVVTDGQDRLTPGAHVMMKLGPAKTSTAPGPEVSG